MRRNALGAITLGLGLLAIPATRAAAESATNVCTSGSLVVCSSFSFGNVGNVWTLTLSLVSVNGTPAATSGAFLSSVGLFNNPQPTGPFTSPSGPAGWTSNTGTTGSCSDLSGPAFASNVYFCFGTNGNSGLTSITFSFTDANAADLAALGSSGVGFHLQGIANGATTCSAKIELNAIVGANGSSSVDATDCTGTSTIPEPASLFLVGSGLMGLGGLGAFRKIRRRA